MLIFHSICLLYNESEEMSSYFYAKKKDVNENKYCMFRELVKGNVYAFQNELLKRVCDVRPRQISMGGRTCLMRL